jgi:hypothetical protein
MIFLFLVLGCEPGPCFQDVISAHSSLDVTIISMERYPETTAIQAAASLVTIPILEILPETLPPAAWPIPSNDSEESEGLAKIGSTDLLSFADKGLGGTICDRTYCTYDRFNPEL